MIHGNESKNLKKLSSIYNAAFFASQFESSYTSAISVFPILFKMLPPINTILDVGCGVGGWLKAAQSISPELKVTGVDHPGLAIQSLLISQKDFVGSDLTQSFDLKRRFDLSITMEVAEHLPESAAETFIDNLVRHSSLVLFSAAIPGQGGASHINEQWPSYWIGKFFARGYQCYDVVRPLIWEDEKVQFWYRQNAFIFTNESNLGKRFEDLANWSGHRLVHPACLEGELGIQSSVKLLMKSLAKRIRRSAYPQLSKNYGE